MTCYYLHHLNDFSGSPLILERRLQDSNSEEPITLITNAGHGFLTQTPYSTVRLPYVKHPNKALRFFSLSLWYLAATFYLLVKLRRGDKIIASTLISSPLLALVSLRSRISAELMVNEVYFRVPLWSRLGLKMAASERVTKVYLSRFVQDQWKFRGPAKIVYPKPRKDLVKLSRQSKIPQKNKKSLKFFLVASYTVAKGYKLFIEIAEYYETIAPSHSFHLYLSGDEMQFFRDHKGRRFPRNLHIIFNETDASIFFGKDIFLGLTDKRLWIETFGQTFAEAMLAGNIVVLPDEGAHLEYVTEGKTGFFFADYTRAELVRIIEAIIASNDLYELASNARSAMKRFFSLSELHV